MNDARPRLLLVTAHASRAGGGVSVAVRDLARIMTHDFDVRVLALADGPTRAEDEPEWQGIAVTTFATLGPQRYGFSPRLLFAVLRAKARVVHVHGLWKFHCFAVLLLYLMRRMPYVVTPHGMLEPWILARSPRSKRIIVRAYQNRFLRATAAVHVLTPQEGRDVAAAIGAQAAARCVVIPNFVAPAPAHQPRPAWWDERLEGRDVYLFLGRIHSKKGCLELCEAWETLNVRDATFRDRAALVFCGVVDDLPDFPARVGDLAERFGNVRYVGPQYGKEKHHSLAAATFFCLPSKSEGLPIAVIEAWAAGVPAIITAECNLPAGFARGAAIATGTDPAAIAESLQEAATISAEGRARMGLAARTIYEEEFSVAKAHNAYLDLYRNVVCNAPYPSGRR